MRLRDLTPTERAAVEALRARLRDTHGDEADGAPYMTRWRTHAVPGGLILDGQCWGHPVFGDQFVRTSRVVELSEAHARTESGRLYLLGSEDREHRRKRVLAGQRGPLLIAPPSEPEASPCVP